MLSRHAVSDFLYNPITQRGKTAPLFMPCSQPQRAALASDAQHLLYGGEAGGGKTGFVIGCAILEHHNAVIFRREYPQSVGILEQSTKFLHGHARWSGKFNMWKFPDGRQIRIGAMQRIEDWRKWAGHEYDYIAFDEGAEFAEVQFRSMQAWNRTVRPNQRCRIVVASNPPRSAEGRWVMEYWGAWLDKRHPDYPTPPGEVLYYVTLDGRDVRVDSDAPIEHDGQWIHPTSRTFIPASLDDNPYLRDSTAYRGALDNLPEPLRSQLRDGNWEAGLEDGDYQLIPTAWVEAAFDRWKNGSRPITTQDALGVDVAIGGKDRLVIAARYKNWLDRVLEYKGVDVPSGGHAATLVINAREDDAVINLDAAGVGVSPRDNLVDNGFPVNAINSSHGSTMTDRSGMLKMKNRRAELCWSFREMLDPTFGEDVALPPDSELLAELTAIDWKATTSGIQIQSKEEIKKKLGRSPDKAEAVIYAFDRRGTFELPTIAGDSQIMGGLL